jgi:hypothetical protein
VNKPDCFIARSSTGITMLGNVVGARWILIEALDINFPPKSRGSSRSFDGRTAKTLVGATMPNGQKYEDWLGT